MPLLLVLHSPLYTCDKHTDPASNGLDMAASL